MVRSVVYPGSKADRVNYMTVRFVPLLVVALWLHLPVGSSPTLNHNVNAVDPDPPRASFWMYLALFIAPYTLCATGLGISLYALVLPLPPTWALLAVALATLVVDSAARAAIYLLELEPLALIFPFVTIVSSVPFFFGMGWYAWIGGKDRHAMARWISDRDSRAEHLADFVFRKAKDSTARAAHAARSLSLVATTTALSHSSDGSSVDSDGNTRSGYATESLASSSSSAPSSSSSSYDSYTLMTADTGSDPESALAASSSLLPCDSDSLDDDILDDEPSFVITFVWLMALLTVILLTFAFCQIFTYAFTELSQSSDSPSTVVQVLFVLVFTIPMFIFKTLTRFVVGRFDTVHEADIKPVAMFMQAMFFFVFQRNLFVEIDSYAGIVVINIYDVLIDLLVYGLLTTKTAHRVQSRAVRWLRRLPGVSVIVPAPVSYQLFVQDSVIDYFFYVVAESMSLLAFGLYSVTLHYSWNAPSYPYTERDGITHRSHLPRFAAYIGITLGFSIISVISIRYLHSRSLHIASFELGALVLHLPRVRLALVLVATHVLQDLALALFKLNFSDPP